jgi:hypothetical protein
LFLTIARATALLVTLVSSASVVEAAVLHAHKDNLTYTPLDSLQHHLMQELHVGSNSRRPIGGRGILFPFQLPAPEADGPAPVLRASFSMTVLSLIAAPDYGIDLYASGPWSASKTFAEPLHYMGADDPNATIIQRSFDFGSPTTPIVRSTSSTADERLTGFLNGLYADPSNVDKYFFLRLNPDRETVTGKSGYIVLGTDPFYAPTAPEYLDLGAVPTIEITYVPEPAAATAGLLMIAVAALRARARGLPRLRTR